jgi:tetratricopeptide (TPR) repeat protein
LGELYLVAGQICALMSVASFDLAAWPAAIEQAHAAAAYAELAGHPALEAWASGMQALTAYWCGRAREAVSLADAALAIAPDGTARARLYSISARAWSHLGAAASTREALALADQERDSIGQAGDDELHDVIGGEFGWGPARQAMSSASALLLIGDSSGAADRAREAIRLGTQDHAGKLVGMRAQADLACAELAQGELDAADEALRPVWELAPEHGLVERLCGVAGVLTRSPFAGAAGAAALAERIETFAADSAPRSLPPGSGGMLLPGGK